MSGIPTLIKRNALLIGMIVLAIGAGFWWFAPAPQKPNAPAVQTPNVIVAQVIAGDAVETFEALGTVKSFESLIVTPKISSYIKTIHANAGQIVKTGDPIITLTAEERKADVQALVAQLAQAQAKRDDAARMLARGEELSKQGFIATGKIATLRSDFQVAQQVVEALKAQSAMAGARLEDTILRAPFDGIVGIIDVQSGSYVTAGVKLTTLTRSDNMKVELALPERSVPFLKIGQAATVTPIAMPNTSIQGTVQEIDSEISPATRQVRVNVQVPNPNSELTQGMSVIVKIAATVRSAALLIPEEAVIGDGLRQFTFTIDADGIASRKLIKTGVRTAGMVEVLEGLQAGDRVVSEGHQKIRHGQKVNSALK